MTNIKGNFKRTILKRRLATEKGCLMDLKEELPKFFLAFQEACESFNREVILTPIEARCRGYEASLFNSKLIQGIQKYFPNDWKYGKYKRFILNKDGYLMLFKKLNNKGMPMNVKTKVVQSINSQMMGSLFGDVDYVEDPILYFGYKKDRLGNIISPQIVYIDESQIQWTIGKNDIFTTKEVALGNVSETKAEPKLRRTKQKDAK